MKKLPWSIALVLSVAGIAFAQQPPAATTPPPGAVAAPVVAPAAPGTPAPQAVQPAPSTAVATMTLEQQQLQAQAQAQAQAQQVAAAQAAQQAQSAQPQMPPPGSYGQQQVPQYTAADLQAIASAQQMASNPQAAPSVAPASLPPLPGSNRAEVEWATDKVIGVTPEQIREIRRMLDARQRAQAELPNPPRPVTSSVSVSLSPGSTPPVIRPFIGSTSSFVVVDSTGAPWPVENFRVGNPEAFPVNRLDAGQGSAFTIDAMVPYGQSNLVLKLAGVATPVSINLVAGQKEFDARVEMRVQGRGPNATVSVGTLMRGTDARMLPVLDGVSPQGGKSVVVSGLEGVRAWIMPNGRLLVRSPVKIVSPASPSFVTSADGTHVYEFAPTTQLLGLVDGQFVTMTVAGW